MTFKDALLAELIEEAPGIARRSHQRRVAVRAAAVTVAAAAVTGAATAGVAGLDVAPARAAAYTITGQGHTITVHIREFRDPGRLQADLAKRGVRTNIVYLPPDTTCQLGWLQSSWDISDTIVDALPSDDIQIHTDKIPKNATLALLFSEHRTDPAPDFSVMAVAMQHPKTCKASPIPDAATVRRYQQEHPDQDAMPLLVRGG